MVANINRKQERITPANISPFLYIPASAASGCSCAGNPANGASKIFARFVRSGGSAATADGVPNITAYRPNQSGGGSRNDVAHQKSSW